MFQECKGICTWYGCQWKNNVFYLVHLNCLSPVNKNSGLKIVTVSIQSSVMFRKVWKLSAFFSTRLWNWLAYGWFLHKTFSHCYTTHRPGYISSLLVVLHGAFSGIHYQCSEAYSPQAWSVSSCENNFYKNCSTIWTGTCSVTLLLSWPQLEPIKWASHACNLVIPQVHSAWPSQLCQPSLLYHPWAVVFTALSYTCHVMLQCVRSWSLGHYVCGLTLNFTLKPLL